MTLVKWTAYGCFAMAVMSVVLAMSNEDPTFLGAGLAVLIMGVGFWAGHLALGLLTDIRNALVPQAAVDHSTPLPTTKQAQTSSRSAAEIAADIAAMKARG